MRNDEERKAIDRSDMLGVIYSLPDQMEEGLDAEVEFQGESENVIVAGMGGSAIAGDILRIWLGEQGKPLLVVRDPSLPSWIKRDDLLICISYSGNTSETLDCLNEGIRRGCRILCITADGRMRDICESRNLPITCVPTGLPPRGALGYLFTTLARVATDDPRFMTEMEAVIHSLKTLREKLVPESEENIAHSVALEIISLYPLIYADERHLPIARRWKTQLNENSKKHAWFGCFPEINHNEVVGWDQDEGTERFCAIFLKDDETSARMNVTIEQLRERTKVIEIQVKGENLLSRMFQELMIGDFVSYYCALSRGIDPTPVDAIQRIKDSK
ncbi:MAG: bifunctional phosphoglucose/phosphomannose isomerase [Thermoplasmata archaeon]